MYLKLLYKFIERNLLLYKKGKKYNIITDIIKAITPPIFLGTERKIVYANKKYHSG